jgi:hypothetical protein
MPIPIIIAAIGAAASVASAASGVDKASKERYFSQQLAFLNQDEQNQLAKKLEGAKSNDERVRILTSAVSSVEEARLKGLTTVQLEREKTKKTLLVVGIAGAVVLLLTVLLVSKRN